MGRKDDSAGILNWTAPRGVEKLVWSPDDLERWKNQPGLGARRRCRAVVDTVEGMVKR